MNVSDANRLIAFPYSKLMVANSAVNQGAAFIITSETEARRRRISEDRLVYVGLGAAAHEPADVLARENFHRSVSLQLTLSRTLELNRLAAEDLDLAELYSCFPCIPKMAMRAIGWPVDRPATVAGGLTFAGGPIGNYMSHAIAAMTERLRHSGRHGLLFGNGGFATYNHAIVLSRDQRVAARHPAAFSVQAESDSLRGRPPGFLDGYVGHGTIETYTVLYDRNGRPARGAIVALTPNRERFLASVPASDERTIEFLTDASCEPVGKPGTASAGPDGLTVWTPSN